MCSVGRRQAEKDNDLKRENAKAQTNWTTAAMALHPAQVPFADVMDP
jgi:hypothetical protein